MQQRLCHQTSLGLQSGPGLTIRAEAEQFTRSVGEIFHLPGTWAHDFIPWITVIEWSCCVLNVQDPRSKLGLLRCGCFQNLGEHNTQNVE